MQCFWQLFEFISRCKLYGIVPFLCSLNSIDVSGFLGNKNLYITSQRLGSRNIRMLREVRNGSLGRYLHLKLCCLFHCPSPSWPFSTCPSPHDHSTLNKRFLKLPLKYRISNLMVKSFFFFKAIIDRLSFLGCWWTFSNWRICLLSRIKFKHSSNAYIIQYMCMSICKTQWVNKCVAE